MSTEKPKDKFEEFFGKRPEKGYKFNHIEVNIVDNNVFKGFNIRWSAQGVGFGELSFCWGIDLEHLKDSPKQQGLYLSTECMSDDFVHALFKKAMPKIVELLLKKRID